MYTCRFVPHRLIPFLLPVLFTACVSDRYVGSIGHDGTYSNRGYGFAVFLRKDDLDTRWRPLDPRAPKPAEPSALKPILYEAPLDLDGDGTLSMGETTRFLRPALLLTSRSAPDVSMAIDVRILSARQRKASLDALLLYELTRAAGTATVASAPTTEEVPPLSSDFQVRVGEVVSGESAHRIAVIDQDRFIAEGGRIRRQIVRVALTAPAITPELRRDHDLLVSALLLNRRGGPETNQEKW